ncbi:SelB C-terminal domain-containing protein [Candidatus Binatia bacterium]|nr:SelB C-terminal domain-containing protein [Candidatus Binatia bacterium]
MLPATIGTAGPAGHGKTALVRALSGLPVGDDAATTTAAVDLGFHFADIAGRRFGIVDLPGTARLVRSLIADTHGIDLFLLVVASDVGVVPQTEECLDILHLLEARDVVFVLTRTDLVDEARAQQVRSQVAQLASSSRFGRAPVVAVSNVTGAGITELRAEVLRRAAQPPPRPSHGWFRMFVDRSFHLAERGLTVTGTVLAGSVRSGLSVAFRPGGAAGSVAGLQVHGQSVVEATVGQRVAVRLAEAERKIVRRGVVLADARVEFTTDRVDCWVEVRPSAPQPMRSFERVEIDVGTVETVGSMIVLEPGDALAPGSAGFCQLALERELILAHGDRFVLRPASGPRTTAGGTIVHPFAVRHASGEAGVRARLERLRVPALPGRVLAFHELLPEIAAPVAYVAQALGCTDDEVRRAAAGIPDLIALPGEDAHAYALRARWSKLVANVEEVLRQHHRAHPAQLGMDAETLRSRLRVPVPPRLLEAVVARLVADSVLLREDDVVKLAQDRRGPAVAPPPPRAPRARSTEAAPPPAGDPTARIRRALETGGMSPPDLRQLTAVTGLDAQRVATIVDELVHTGDAVRISAEVAFVRDAYEKARTQLTELLEQTSEVTMGEYRTRIGSSRKYALALLEHFDAEGLTERIGDARRRKS